MIVVRDVFQLKFGKMRDAQQLWQEGRQFSRNNGNVGQRVMTDLVGDYYTLVMEQSYNSLSDYEKAMQNTMGSDEWRNWYKKFTDLVESGKREIFKVVE